jgi:hypothetical protein
MNEERMIVEREDAISPVLGVMPPIAGSPAVPLSQYPGMKITVMPDYFSFCGIAHLHH